VITLKKNIMRKTYLKLLLALMIPVSFFSCTKKETNDKIDELEKYYVDNPEAITQVKFVHAYTALTINGTAAAVTATNGTVSGTGFRITMDGNKLNGAQNTAANTNTLIWGGVYPPTSGAYAFLPPGLHNFKFIMNRITSGAFAPITGDEVFNTSLALVPGKKYSMFIADPYGPPGVYTIEDNFKEPSLDKYGVRFINLCADAASRFDVTSARLGQVLFSNVGYKEMKDFIYLPTNTITDTLYLRNAGTTTVVAQLPGFNGRSQRVYTLYARGKTGVSGREPSITSYTNR
jgi:hypothetical protein